MKKSFNIYSEERKVRVVQINNEAGDQQVITATFDEAEEDWDNLSEERLIEKCHEWYYKKFMLGKFVNEAVDITETKAKEMTELAEKMKKVFADSESELASFKERSELAQGSIVEMTEMVFDHELRLSMLEGGGLDEEVDIPIEDENTGMEGGE